MAVLLQRPCAALAAAVMKFDLRDCQGCWPNMVGRAQWSEVKLNHANLFSHLDGANRRKLLGLWGTPAVVSTTSCKDTRGMGVYNIYILLGLKKHQGWCGRRAPGHDLFAQACPTVTKPNRGALNCR